MPKNSSQTCSVSEAARAMGFTLKYVYDLVYSGRMPASKLAGRWRIRKTEIEAHLRKRGQQ